MSIQISSNGLISLGTSYTSYTPEAFPISSKVIAPYWDDIDLRQQGQINYTLVTTQNDSVGSIALVNNFLASNISVNFSADWILVAQWVDVCPYGNSDCTNVSYVCSYLLILLINIIYNSEAPFKLYWPLKARLHILFSHMNVKNSNGQIILLQLGLVSMILSTKTIHYQDKIK